MDGLLVVDKPPGPTSHDVVARVRRVLGESRVGHTGTLDPGASGVLPLVLGRATRLARFMSGANKRYEAVVRLGQSTDSYDADGVPVGGPTSMPLPSRAQIEAALDAFRGTFDQQPPVFSAKKIAGRRSYEAARATRRAARTAPPRHRPGPPDLSEGPEPPDRAMRPHGPALPAPVRVTAFDLAILGVSGDSVTLDIRCSAGFYVRSLAHDLGARLGVGGHLAALRRTESGGITLSDALPLETAERDREAAYAAVVPLEGMLKDLPAVELTPRGVERAAHGQDVGSSEVASGTWLGAPNVRLFDQQGHLIGIGDGTRPQGVLHPCVVLR